MRDETFSNLHFIRSYADRILRHYRDADNLDAEAMIRAAHQSMQGAWVQLVSNSRMQKTEKTS